MTQVRAKFFCSKIDEHPTLEQKVVNLYPVLSGSEENKSFAKYTPGGNVQLVISYETQAADFFTEGKEYFLDFSEAN